jgi:osmotically-inducible protein OsmY
MIMKKQSLIAAALSAFLLVSVVGCASTSKQEGTGEYVDDAVITTKVKAAIFNEPSLKSTEINVETYKGAVQLSGFVSSQADINKAVDVARSVKGVVSVKNNMHVK